jgi:hypothetical protein
MQRPQVSELRSFRIFGSLDDARLARVAALARALEVDAADVLIPEGEQAKDVFLICSGKVEVYRPVGDREHVIATLGPGDVLGELGFLGEAQRSASARVVEKSRLLAVDIASLQGLLDQDPSFQVIYRVLAEELDQRLRRTTQATVMALERELEEQKARVVVGTTLVILMAYMSAYVLALGFAVSLTEGRNSSIVTAPLGFFGLLGLYVMYRALGLPPRFYGLTLEGWRKSLTEGVLFTLPILVLLVLLRWLYTELTGRTADLPLIGLPPRAAQGGMADFLVEMGIYLALVAPVQELVARGAL